MAAASRFRGLTLGIISLGALAADHVKIGTLPTTGNAPLYLAIEKGYFAAEGIDEFAAGQGPGNHVHPKVSPGKVVAERDLRPALDLEVAMPVADRAFATG